MYRHKPRFIHIGYPKSASTSFQIDYFNKHRQIYSLGWFHPLHKSGWADEFLAAFMEVDLRTGRAHCFDPEKGAAALQPHLNIADHDDSIEAVCLSWESLCFTLVYDVDVFTKACRLFDLFGFGTRIIVVLRNQLDLIRSMYLEMVRGGFAKPFRDYLEFLYYYRFTGITEDLYYDDILRIYGDLFGYEHILIVTLEDLASNAEFELHRLSGFMGVDDQITEIGRHNASDDRRLLEALRRVNADHPHNFGEDHFTFLDSEKIEGYWHRLNLPLPEAATRSITMRAKNLERAKVSLSPDTPAIDTSYPDDLRKAFVELYTPHNNALAETWGLRRIVDLGYPV